MSYSVHDFFDQFVHGKSWEELQESFKEAATNPFSEGRAFDFLYTLLKKMSETSDPLESIKALLDYAHQAEVFILSRTSPETTQLVGSLPRGFALKFKDVDSLGP